MTYKKCENKNIFADNSTVDVQFEGNEVLLIKQKKWTTKELETQVAAFHYTGEKLPIDPDVEKARLPPFALAFYKYIFFKSRLPDETELWEYYVNRHFTTIDDEHIQTGIRGTLKTFATTSVKARLLRSYPSLVRDFHFYVLCLTSGQFERVSYSLRQDYFEGIDLCVHYSGFEFHVSILLNSQRARTYKNQKYGRHTEMPKNEVVMLFDLTQFGQVKKKIKLFSSNHVEILIEELKRRIGSCNFEVPE
ncbi:hypothetical protein [Runella sp.]|uniref:hypothetical protein n=1 Tax=Runella sp. TaxID=1960881 RepID=UPI003D0F73C8